MWCRSESSFTGTKQTELSSRCLFQGTKLVVKDGNLAICDDLLKDKAYADAVDIVGLHYPSDFGNFSVPVLDLSIFVCLMREFHGKEILQADQPPFLLVFPAVSLFSVFASSACPHSPAFGPFAC